MLIVGLVLTSDDVYLNHSSGSLSLVMREIHEELEPKLIRSGPKAYKLFTKWRIPTVFSQQHRAVAMMLWS